MTRARRIWLILGLSAAGVILIVFGVLAYYANRLEPLAREKIISHLEEKFESDVELKSLNIRALPRLRVVGKGLVLRWKRRTDIPPLINLGEFSFRLEWEALAAPVIHIAKVELKDFELNMPPRGTEPREAAKDEPVSRPQDPKPEEPPKPGSVVVDEIVADRTLLRLLPRDSNKRAKEFELHQLQLRGVGAGRPMAYQTRMQNYKPPGIIHCAGEFGPWIGADPGESPLNGDYTFSDADLGVFKGIGGIMQAAGKFDGKLQHIIVDGTADIPQFRLTYAKNPVHLKTKYHAIVDGTSGNTILDPVEATLGQTPMIVKGGIIGEKDVKGKNIELDAVITNGRLDDVLQLAVKGGTPMRGRIDLRTKILLPRGDVDVIEKLGLNGKFRMAGVRFVNPEIQSKIDGLSTRAQGKPSEERTPIARSRFEGDFRLQNSVINIGNLTYGIPGAEVDLQGSYGLRSEQIDFAGVLRLDAKASQMFTGYKSILLKPLDGLVTRRGKGTVLSITVGGTREHPKYGVDVSRTLKKKDK